MIMVRWFLFIYLRSNRYPNEAHEKPKAKQGNPLHVENTKITNAQNIATALSLGDSTNLPGYELPDLTHLSIAHNGKVPDAIQGASQNFQGAFDDGIPMLPDLGCFSDHGSIDPLGRLYKAESAVSESSNHDLMSDLPSNRDELWFTVISLPVLELRLSVNIFIPILKEVCFVICGII